VGGWRPRGAQVLPGCSFKDALVVSYLLHVTSLSSFWVLANYWKDRRSTTWSERTGDLLQQWLGVFGATIPSGLSVVVGLSLFGSLGCLVLGVASPAFLLDL
jgi:hypothetical protein